MNNFSSREKKLLSLIVLFFLLLIGLIFGQFFREKEEGLEFVSKANSLDNLEESVEKTPLPDNGTKIFVHISGAILHPGLLELDSNSRLVDAIDAAGGSLSDADLNQINLARKLTDEERIHIPKIGENTQILPLAETSQTSESSGKININRGDKSQLMELPGVGEKTADKIILYREKNPFKTIEDLKEVPGIGEKKFEELKEKIDV